VTNLDQNLAQAMQHLNQNRIEEAGKIAAELLEEFPVEAQVLHLTGLVEFKRGNYTAAIKEMEKAAQISKRSPLILGNLAEAYRRDSNLEKALEVFERSLIIMPEFLKGHLGVANVLKDMKRYPEAISKYRLALAINASFAPAYHYLGVLYHEIERTKEALPLLKKAVSLRKGNYPEAQIVLANLLEWDGQTEKALALYHKLLEGMPNQPGILNSVGTILRNLGRIDESLEYFEKAKKLNPNQPGGYFSASQTDSEENAGDIAHMEKILKGKKLAPEHRCSIHMTLGKMYDDIGDYKKAFHHFKSGNDLDERDKAYHPKQHEMSIERVKNIYSADFFENNKDVGSDEETPVFVVGIPRSGTTLCEQTIASHPDVVGAGELTLIAKQIGILQEKQGNMAAYPECMSMLDPVTACQLGDGYVDDLRLLGGETSRFITDKMPGNFMNVGFIATILPNAKIINMKREPLDSCLSCYFQYFAQVMPFSRNLEYAAHYYRNYLKIMAHWEAVLPNQVMTVNYSDLVEDHEGTTRKMLDFIALDWNDSCHNFQDVERSVKTASSWQVRQPIYKSSLARWKNYAPYIGDLISGLGDDLTPDVRDWLKAEGHMPKASKKAKAKKAATKKGAAKKGTKKAPPKISVKVS